MQEILVK